MFQDCVHALLTTALEMEKKGNQLGEHYLNRTEVHNFLNWKIILNCKNQEQQNKKEHLSFSSL